MYLKHGLSQTPEYRCWQQIKSRCLEQLAKRVPYKKVAADFGIGYSLVGKIKRGQSWA